jgi:hypothetical protein
MEDTRDTRDTNKQGAMQVNEAVQHQFILALGGIRRACADPKLSDRDKVERAIAIAEHVLSRYVPDFRPDSP